MQRSEKSTTRAYKEVTLQQLRSFCETARLGSLSAAADAIGLAHPTVWKQVHALEREFGLALIEPYGRGCRLTDAGRVLAELAMPTVVAISQLKRRVHESLALAETTITVATTPRVLQEELPECVQAFERAWPQVRLHFREMRDDQVAEQVEAGLVDLGVSPDAGQATEHPWLDFETGGELEVMLVTPAKHPLARKKQVTPADLLSYPLVNAPDAFGQSNVTMALRAAGLFNKQPRVEAFYSQTIRRYVSLGFGIGLVSRLARHKAEAGLHERSMSAYFGRHRFLLVWRKGVNPTPAARAFADVVAQSLQGKSPPRRSKP
jgi:DNA-binding transcriptional LysR family regulator